MSNFETIKANGKDSAKVLNGGGKKQDLDIYWNPEMAQLLETWGKDHVWNEIQMFLACSKGRVLDIACGTGVTIKIVSENKNLEVWGCDISDFLIKKAEKRGIEKKYLNVCDATNMDCYGDDYFDFSYSIGSLEHFTEEGIAKFVNETHRITKQLSFHKVPVSRAGRNEGWIKKTQSYFNNSEQWWAEKFQSKYHKVVAINSGWKDDISIGKWFVCYKSSPVQKPASTPDQTLQKEEFALSRNETISSNGKGDAAIIRQALALMEAGQNSQALALIKDELHKNMASIHLQQAHALLLVRMGQSPQASPVVAPAPKPTNTEEFYGPAPVNATTLRNIAVSPETWNEILSFHGQLATDPYVAYVDRYYRQNRERFGRHWFYLDVTNVMYAAAKAVQPKHYLEIGVRRGRSACVVARACSDVRIHAFDMWIPSYAGMENPGPEFVRSELIKHGYRGQINFVDGDSHKTLTQYFRENPNICFDLVLVDGDHSDLGALQDLNDAIPRLAPGGILVFDDIAHPAHPGLLNVWRKATTRPEFSTFEFSEAGYGVAFAVKKG